MYCSVFDSRGDVPEAVCELAAQACRVIEPPKQRNKLPDSFPAGIPADDYYNHTLSEHCLIRLTRPLWDLRQLSSIAVCL
jgi:hypothetical protein